MSRNGASGRPTSRYRLARLPHACGAHVALDPVRRQAFRHEVEPQEVEQAADVGFGILHQLIVVDNVDRQFAGRDPVLHKLQMRPVDRADVGQVVGIVDATQKASLEQR